MIYTTSPLLEIFNLLIFFTKLRIKYNIIEPLWRLLMRSGLQLGEVDISNLLTSGPKTFILTRKLFNIGIQRIILQSKRQTILNLNLIVTSFLSCLKLRHNNNISAFLIFSVSGNNRTGLKEQ